MSRETVSPSKVVELCKQVLRMTTAAGSGHPSSALSIAHIVADLMYCRMRYEPENPWNPLADRLVLSEGHAVPILYAAYADLGGVVGKSKGVARPLRREEVTDLRKLESVLDGHPNPALGFPFFDAATGSLGQGLSVAAGLAIAAELEGLDKNIFVIIGDGESREGQVWEALDFIAERGLNHICAIFNCNGEGQAADVSSQQSPEGLKAKASAFGWEAVTINGHDLSQIASSLSRAGKSERPLAVIARTIKGWGVEALREGNHHGKPLPKNKLELGLSQLNEAIKAVREEGKEAAYPPSPSPATHLSKKPITIHLPPFEDAIQAAGLQDALHKQMISTRSAYGAALLAAGELHAGLVALDADVSNSTYSEYFAKAFPGRFIECKIAEQNMMSTAVGLAAAGKLPFASSFAKFISRAYDQIEMAAITRANIKLVGSHSGVSLAADGPSQMSLPDVAYFRSMAHVRYEEGSEPLCRVFHPSDAVCAYRCVELMANTRGMCYLRTHRPNAPLLYKSDEAFALGEIKRLRDGDRLIIVSSGYMLHPVWNLLDELAKEGIRCALFDAYSLPLDALPVLDTARAARCAILVVEDNYVGGVYSEIAEAAARDGDVRVHGLTVTRLPKSAHTAEEVFQYCGVGKDRMRQTILSLL